MIDMKHARPILLVVLGILVVGCLREKVRVYPPLRDTAREQYNDAVLYRETHQLELIDRFDDDRRENAQIATRQMFEKVIEYFPQEREWTPLAKLEIANMHGGLARFGNREIVSERSIRTAIEQLQQIRSDYPEHEFIYVKSLYDEGLCWKQLRDYQKAQDAFRTVKELDPTVYKNETITQIIASSNYYYNQVYVVNPDK